MATVTPLKPAPPPPRIWHYMDRANIKEAARELHLLDLALGGLASPESPGSHPDDIPSLQYQVMRIQQIVSELEAALGNTDGEPGKDDAS